MKEDKQFTPTENRVLELLLQGKSNKDIAQNLGVEVTTIEFHLGNIYTKMNVHSRGEAMAQLGKSIGENTPRESRVAGHPEKSYKKTSEQPTAKRRISSRLITQAVIVLLTVYILMIIRSNVKTWTYEREAEFPDRSTVGQAVDRSNASGKKVHGQFGSLPVEPWSPKDGSVRYYNIDVPKSGELYLKLRYSKFSQSSVRILMYLDDEATPREVIQPIDQGDWNKFTWTEWIRLGEISKGMHSIMFYTDGQEFGVADLDKFILTNQPPE